MLRSFVFLGVFVSSSALAVPVDDDGPAYIVSGKEEKGYPSAVAIGMNLPAEFGGGQQSTCSASLITPRVLLTAAHCSEEFGFPTSVLLTIGAAFFAPKVDGNAPSVGFADIVPHPRYQGIDRSNPTPKHDVEIIELAEEITDIDPVWFRTAELTDADVAGVTLVSVGYGVTNGQTQQGGGTKRSGKLTVELGYDYGIPQVPPVPRTFLVSNTANNPQRSNVCSGDSGGPQYFTKANGQLEQWSIHSWADQYCQASSGSYRTDVDADWILGEVERIHGTSDHCEINGAYNNAACDNDCDEPDPECELDLNGDGAIDAADDLNEDGVVDQKDIRKSKGCATSGGPGGWLALTPLLALLRRRR